MFIIYPTGRPIINFLDKTTYAKREIRGFDLRNTINDNVLAIKTNYAEQMLPYTRKERTYDIGTILLRKHQPVIPLESIMI